MPQRSLKKCLPYAPEQLFDLVADIEKYPFFLPWCREALVLERHANSVIADLVVGNGAASARTRSHVSLEKPAKIVIANDERFKGAVAHLSGAWTFRPMRTKACEVVFSLDFRMQSPVLNALASLAFPEAFERIVRAFEARAKELYGKRPA